MKSITLQYAFEDISYQTFEKLFENKCKITILSHTNNTIYLRFQRISDKQIFYIKIFNNGVDNNSSNNYYWTPFSMTRKYIVIMRL